MYREDGYSCRKFVYSMVLLYRCSAVEMFLPDLEFRHQTSLYSHFPLRGLCEFGPCAIAGCWTCRKSTTSTALESSKLLFKWLGSRTRIRQRRRVRCHLATDVLWLIRPRKRERIGGGGGGGGHEEHLFHMSTG